MLEASAPNFAWYKGKIKLNWVHFVPDYLPLSLGMILAYAKKQLNPEYFDLSSRFIRTEKELLQSLSSSVPAVFLFSDYLWNVKSHSLASKFVKSQHSNCITIHGGPSFPQNTDVCAKYLRENVHVDYGVVGEGEKTVVELLEHIRDPQHDLNKICGLRYLSGGDYVENAPRLRCRNLDEFPSPYLTGVFDEVYRDAIYAVLETNRGCPYGCAFCDWGSAIQQKVRQFPLDRVLKEIEWISAHKMSDINIADANFGIFSRDVEICRAVCSAKEKTGCPDRLIVNYSKNTHDHMVEIVDMMSSSGLVPSGTISIQTRDSATLVAINRKNIRTSEYDKLEYEFSKRDLPLDSQLMIGLPGATLDSFKQDLRYYFHRDVNIRVFTTILLPNSPMSDLSYRDKFRIETDDSGTIVSTSTLTKQDLKDCETLARMFRCAHTYGVLRYIMCYLDWDHAIDPIFFLDQMRLNFGESENQLSSRWPLLHKFCAQDQENEQLVAMLTSAPKEMSEEDSAFGPARAIPATHIRFRERLRQERNWHAFYGELAQYVDEKHGIAGDSVATVLKVQEALMPQQGLKFPLRVQLKYDFVNYYKDRVKSIAPARPLDSYKSAIFVTEDPLNISELGTYRNDWTLSDFWQLLSPLGGAGRSTLPRLVRQLKKDWQTDVAADAGSRRVSPF
jgi:radical SAM superfamily enzyme YgiQ (UPF0313 family)